MILLWTKWILVALFSVSFLSLLADVRKHGQPRSPHNGTVSAAAACFALLLVLWLIAVVP